MAEQQFPVTKFTVGDDGILCETFYSLTISSRLIIPEAQANELFHAWGANQKRLHPARGKRKPALKL